MSILTHPSLPMSVPGTPDLLVNSLELKRTLRKWSHDKEKVIRVKGQNITKLSQTILGIPKECLIKTNFKSDEILGADVVGMFVARQPSKS